MIPIALHVVAAHIKNWQDAEIIALARHDEDYAHGCQRVVAALKRLAVDLQGEAAA